VLWEAFKAHYGQDSPVLIWKAPTTAMNPTIAEAFVAAEIEKDEAAARAEYLAEFRTDVETFLSREAVEACRLTESTGGQLLYQFRRPWSDGSTALLLDPLELLGRLAALVPPPRRPLLAYHGLLGPRSRWRSAIVPKPSPPDSRVDVDTRAPRRWPWARLLQRVFGFDVLVCDRCGGRRRILGAVTEPHAVRRLLAALGLAPEPPPGRPAPAA
jgi:hypothetical protein